MQLDRRDFLIRVALALGGTLSSACSSMLLERDPSQPAKPSRSVFSAEQRELVATAVETIIPTTDTPGARAAGVPDFVEMMLVDWYRDDEREHFLAGLAALDSACLERTGENFVQASPADRIDVLEAAEGRDLATLAASGIHPMMFLMGGNPPPTFFHALKELTVVGYYTSEIGSTRELALDLVPGRYEGCIPLADGRAWF